MRRARPFLAIYALVASCSGGTRPAKETGTEPAKVPERVAAADAGAPPPRGPYVAGATLEAGQIAGMVTLPGEPVTAPPAKTACGGRAAETLVRTPAGGVAGALVYVEGIRRGKALPDANTVEVALRSCRYEPAAAMVARAGSRLRVRNEDPLRHVFTLAYTGADGGAPPERTAEAPAPLEGQSFELVLDRVGQYELGCALHAGERAWVVVPEHPYHVVTDADGRFAIDDVPAGEAHVVAWHRPIVAGGRPLRGEVRVQVARDVTVDGSVVLASP